MARKGLTPERLVEAAALLADQAGVAAVTLTALARHFDVQVASLYSHLKNSDALHQRLAQFALDKLALRAEEAVAGRSGRDALLAIANVHREFARDHPGLFEAARYRLPGPFGDDHGGVRISRVTRAVLRGYGLEDADAVHATRLLASIFLGYSMLEAAGSFNHRAPDSQASWLRCLDALDDVLRSWQPHR